MIFLLIHISICKQIYSDRQISNKNLLLYIDPYDIIEITIGSSQGIFFSSWVDFDDLLMDVYSYSDNNNSVLLQEFGSNDGLIGLGSQNLILQIRNEGNSTYKLFVMIRQNFPSYYDIRDIKIPDWVSMPILEYKRKASLNEISDLKSPYIISYDSGNSKILTLNILLMFALGIIVFINLFYFFCKVKSTNK